MAYVARFATFRSHEMRPHFSSRLPDIPYKYQPENITEVSEEHGTYVVSASRSAVCLSSARCGRTGVTASDILPFGARCLYCVRNSFLTLLLPRREELLQYSLLVELAIAVFVDYYKLPIFWSAKAHGSVRFFL